MVAAVPLFLLQILGFFCLSLSLSHAPGYSLARGEKSNICTCQQKLDTNLKKLGIKIEYLYKAQ